MVRPKSENRSGVATTSDATTASIASLPSETTFAGCSFMVKSRLVKRFRFGDLENASDHGGQVEYLPADDCTIFIMPLQMPNEGSAMQQLRQLLDDEASCLDRRVQQRLWSLRVDAATILTKLVQLNFLVVSCCVAEDVYTWTLTSVEKPTPTEPDAKHRDVQDTDKFGKLWEQWANNGHVTAKMGGTGGKENIKDNNLDSKACNDSGLNMKTRSRVAAQKSAFVSSDDAKSSSKPARLSKQPSPPPVDDYFEESYTANTDAETASDDFDQTSELDRAGSSPAGAGNNNDSYDAGHEELAHEQSSIMPLGKMAAFGSAVNLPLLRYVAEKNDYLLIGELPFQRRLAIRKFELIKTNCFMTTSQPRFQLFVRRMLRATTSYTEALNLSVSSQQTLAGIQARKNRNPVPDQQIPLKPLPPPYQIGIAELARACWLELRYIAANDPKRKKMIAKGQWRVPSHPPDPKLCREWMSRYFNNLRDSRKKTADARTRGVRHRGLNHVILDILPSDDEDVNEDIKVDDDKKKAKTTDNVEYDDDGKNSFIENDDNLHATNSEKTVVSRNSGNINRNAGQSKNKTDDDDTSNPAQYEAEFLKLDLSCAKITIDDDPVADAALVAKCREKFIFLAKLTDAGKYDDCVAAVVNEASVGSGCAVRHVKFEDDCLYLGEPPFQHHMSAEKFRKLKQYTLLDKKRPTFSLFTTRLLRGTIPSKIAINYTTTATKFLPAPSQQPELKQLPEPYIDAVEDIVHAIWYEMHYIVRPQKEQLYDPAWCQALDEDQPLPPTRDMCRKWLYCTMGNLRHKMKNGTKNKLHRTLVELLPSDEEEEMRKQMAENGVGFDDSEPDEKPRHSQKKKRKIDDAVVAAAAANVDDADYFNIGYDDDDDDVSFSGDKKKKLKKRKKSSNVVGSRSGGNFLEDDADYSSTDLLKVIGGTVKKSDEKRMPMLPPLEHPLYVELQDGYLYLGEAPFRRRLSVVKYRIIKRSVLLNKLKTPKFSIFVRRLAFATIPQAEAIHLGPNPKNKLRTTPLQPLPHSYIRALEELTFAAWHSIRRLSLRMRDSNAGGGGGRNWKVPSTPPTAKGLHNALSSYFNDVRDDYQAQQRKNWKRKRRPLALMEILPSDDEDAATKERNARGPDAGNDSVDDENDDAENTGEEDADEKVDDDDELEGSLKEYVNGIPKRRKKNT